jgi:hypothetical protein
MTFEKEEAGGGVDTPSSTKTVDDSTGCSAAARDVSDIITDNESFVTVLAGSTFIWRKPCTS